MKANAGTRARADATREAAVWQSDMPDHPDLRPRTAPPRIETRVSKVIRAPLAQVYQHFWGADRRLRVDLHKDHVKSYHIHRQEDGLLEYEFVFEAYGTRNWGKAVEVSSGMDRIDVEVLAGPLAGQTVTMLFEEVEDGTRVTQVNRVWPGDSDMMVSLMGDRLRSQLTGLAGVHLEQHRADLEGEERFQDRFSKQHQEQVANARTHPVQDFLKTTRAITLPIILLPLIAAAALAAGQGAFSWAALALTLVGGACALLAANLVNDLFDTRSGADQSARTIPGAIETGSGAFVEGRWSTRKGWWVAAVLSLLALGSGLALAVLSTPLVLACAAGGAAIAYFYVGPPWPLAYKGRGLGELSILTAFGILPVAGGVLAHGGRLDARVWWIAAIFGLTSTMVLYHHHFLHWKADKAAGKGSPVALLGPRTGAVVGAGLCLTTAAAVVAASLAGHLPRWGAVLALLPLVVVPAQWRVVRGHAEPPDMVRLATAAFFGGMMLTGVALTLALWSMA